MEPFALRPAVPLVFAHRGGSALAPENTIAAFDRGLACGADGIELDVHLSRDGVAVVHHDARLDRTTDATGPIDDYTAAELARVDAGARFGGDVGHPFRGCGVTIPSLRDVLSRYRDTRFIIELKVNAAPMARATLDEVRRAGAADRVCLGSFGGAVLRAVRREEPSIATGAGREEVRWALYRSRVGWPLPGASYRAFQVPERSGRTRVVTPRFIRAAHRAGVVVQAWTVDEVEDIRRLLDWGVDAIITDRPDVAVPAVRAWVAQRTAVSK